MKKLLLLLISSLMYSSLYAGERDWYLGLSPSAYFNPHTRGLRYGTHLSLEKQLSGRKFVEFSLGAISYPPIRFEGSELIFQSYYKPVLHLGKNSYALFKLGINAGFASQGLTFGVGGGFEYNVIFKNRLKLFISQDNLLVFRGSDRFSMSLSLGLKLPL